MVIVIPAEGDSAETELWYIRGLKEHYSKNGEPPIVRVYQDTNNAENLGLIHRDVKRFFEHLDDEFGHKVTGLEIHAQGGYGAIILYDMALYHWDRISCGFFIGGAPGNAMTGIAKFFHRFFAQLWYLSGVPFFADGPNPHHIAVVDSIRASSTETMSQNRRKYRNQLRLMAKWIIHEEIEFFTTPTQLFFVPNGATVRPSWWDNTYNDKKARTIWSKHGVHVTSPPGGNFSFYSLYPWDELFKVMDQVRTF